MQGVLAGWIDWTKGQRDKGTEGQRDKILMGQRDKWTKIQRDKRTEGLGDKGTKGQWDSETAHMLLEGLKFVLILPPLMSKEIKSTCYIFD